MINSHYVPQFILRNFYSDDKITYCDMDNKTIEYRNTRSIFSEEGYYPENIERDLCKKAEHQFANLYHNKLENARKCLTITADELFVIKKYLVVSAIRFKGEMSEEEQRISEELGPMFKNDYDKSLNDVLACETLEEMFSIVNLYGLSLGKMLFEQGNVDLESLNIFLFGELKEVLQSYMVFIKPRGDEKFIIPDSGRGYYRGPLGLRKMEIPMRSGDPTVFSLIPRIGVRDYVIYPLSPNLAVLTMNIFFKLFTDSEIKTDLKLPPDYPTVSSILGFGSADTICPPKVRMDGKTKEYIYEIKPVTTMDICHLNDIMIAEARRYVACAGLKSIQRSLKTVNNYTERDLSFMRLD